MAPALVLLTLGLTGVALGTTALSAARRLSLREDLLRSAVGPQGGVQDRQPVRQRTVITVLPREWPSSTWRMASAVSARE